MGIYAMHVIQWACSLKVQIKVSKKDTKKNQLLTTRNVANRDNYHKYIFGM